MSYPDWQTITINSWQGGLAERYYETNSHHLRRGFPDAQYSTGVVNPVTIPGILLPSATLTTLLTNSTTIAATIKTFVPFSSGSIMAAENGANFHSIGVSTGIVQNPAFSTITAGTNHSGHTTIRIQDAVAYQLNGTTAFFALYTDNTDGDLAHITTGGATNGAYFSATATGGAALTTAATRLHKAPNGFLYILDGNAIHKLDGTTVGGAAGTATQTVMDFPIGSLAIDSEHWRKFMLIAVNELPSGSTSTPNAPSKKFVYFWNYQSTQGGDVDGFELIAPVIADGILLYVFLHNGIPHTFTRTHTYCEISKFDGNQFTPVKRLGSGDWPHFKGSFFDYLGLTCWVSNDDGMFAYGNVIPGGTDNLYQIDDDIEGGAMINVRTSGFYYLGNGDDQMYSLTIPTSPSSSNTITSTENENYRSDIYHLPMGSRIHGFYIWWEAFTGGGNSNLRFNVYANTPTSGTPTKTILINFQDDGAKGFKFLPCDLQNIYSIQVGLGWPAVAMNVAIKPSRIDIAYSNTTRIK